MWELADIMQINHSAQTPALIPPGKQGKVTD